jgi:hypothetical protein
MHRPGEAMPVRCDVLRRPGDSIEQDRTRLRQHDRLQEIAQRAFNLAVGGGEALVVSRNLTASDPRRRTALCPPHVHVHQRMRRCTEEVQQCGSGQQQAAGHAGPQVILHYHQLIIVDHPAARCGPPRSRRRQTFSPDDPVPPASEMTRMTAHWASWRFRYSPLVRSVTVTGWRPRFRQNQPCIPSNAATSTPSSEACAVPLA